ncbi:uncharacterized protein J3D65DRAFT_344674 [Phyllosticta citribraziliensis]|uniref:Uncharacterized protein n=1 Tax=Phyllosticta citribraziliensis TaxID=989973 RepID=A0ABR1LUE2_9PEZI
MMPRHVHQAPNPTATPKLHAAVGNMTDCLSSVRLLVPTSASCQSVSRLSRLPSPAHSLPPAPPCSRHKPQVFDTNLPVPSANRPPRSPSINSARASICPGRSLGSPGLAPLLLLRHHRWRHKYKRQESLPPTLSFFSHLALRIFPRLHAHAPALSPSLKSIFTAWPACMLLRSRELTAYATWLSARLVPSPQCTTDDLELPCAPQRTDSP